MELVLYDPDLQQYDYKALIKAYNDTVSNVPSAYKNSALLKNLMLKNLESAGQKDPFEILQEQKIEGELGKVEDRKMKELQARKAMAEARRQSIEAQGGGGAAALGEGVISKITGRLASGLAVGGKGVSDILKAQPETADAVQARVDRIMGTVDENQVQAAGGYDEVRARVESWLTDPRSLGTTRKMMEDLGVKPKRGPGEAYPYTAPGEQPLSLPFRDS